jgi:hypothetical protein
MRAIALGIIVFMAFTTSKFIKGADITINTFLPGLIGGIVGGIAVYFTHILFFKDKK